MPRRPEISLGMGLAVVTITYAIYQRGLPIGADTRATPPDDTLETVRKQNAWLAAATVSGISLIAKDATIFILGGLSVVALDWIARSNIHANPVTNAIDLNPFSRASVGPQEAPLNDQGGYDSLQVVS